MNLLTDALPTSVKIGAAVVPIETDFRACLRVILAFEDPQLSDIEKQIVLLRVMYGGNIVPDTAAAAEMAVKFLNGGSASEGDSHRPRHRLYSFQKDAPLIFAAFLQTHGIDLADVEHLHWWKFLALFSDLGQDTTFCGLVALRKRIKDGTATKEEKRAAAQMGEAFEVEDANPYTFEQRENTAEFLRKVRENEERRCKSG